MRKKKEVEKDKADPTPYLGKPRANRQVFTYSENKLLDQITMEINEAWVKDLKTIRECHKAIVEELKDFKSINGLMEDKFHKIDEFIKDDEFFPSMQEIIENQKSIFQFMNEIRLSCFKSEEQVLGLRKLIQDNLKKSDDAPKKWWQFWK